MSEVSSTEPRPGGVAPGELEQDRKLIEDLHALVAGLEEGRDSLRSDVRALVRAHGDQAYAELLFLLSHLRFSAAEARPHWMRILRHQRSMGERLGKPVDLRVAMLSYFLTINRRLKNPKIIEMKLFELERATAYRDDLTGLYNYRLFREHLERELSWSRRSGEPLSLVLIDVDDFKRYNDENGHEAGNEALSRIAQVLARPLRPVDVAARYGGEEFALVLRGMAKVDARAVAEQARAMVEAERVGPLTISAGVATFPADAETPSSLVRQADRALYMAKAAGKNTVTLYGRSRRSYGRVAVELPGWLRGLSDRIHFLTTVDVSEGGFLFRTDYQLRTGSMVEITLQAGSLGEVTASGRVVSVESCGAGGYRTVIRITEARSTDRERLAELVRSASEEEFGAPSTHRDAPLDAEGPGGGGV